MIENVLQLLTIQIQRQALTRVIPSCLHIRIVAKLAAFVSQKLVDKILMDDIIHGSLHGTLFPTPSTQM